MFENIVALVAPQVRRRTGAVVVGGGAVVSFARLLSLTVHPLHVFEFVSAQMDSLLLSDKAVLRWLTCCNK